MADYKIIGKSVNRRDGEEKVTGEGKFTCDVYLPGMLHAKVLRSHLPHARIKSIDTSKAEALPGVRAVITHKNVSDTLFNYAASMVEAPHGVTCVMDQRIVDNVVRYVGDEVAAVAADTVEIAEAALELIKVDYEVLPFVLDPLEAEKPESVNIHPDKLHNQWAHNCPGQRAEIDKGDIDKGFEEADEIVEVSVYLKPVKQMQMETHSAVAEVERDGSIRVWSTTQNVQISRTQLAHIFKVPMSKLHVKNPPYVGGGFGIRIGLSGKAEIIAIALAKAAKKPVKYIYDRHEDLIASDTRHGGYLSVKLGAKKDGTLTALDLSAVLNKGAYASHGGAIFGTTGVMNTALYRCPNIRYRGYSVYTNIAPGGAMRSYGSCQGNITVNRAIDEMADRLGIDPLEFRYRTATRKGDEYTLPYANDSSTLYKCMETGAKNIEWHKRGEYNAQKGTLRRGLGMSIGTHWSGGYPFMVDYENAFITLQADGSVNVATPANDIGTGSKTTLAQIAAEALDVPLECVNLTYADSESTLAGFGSHSSRSVYMHGNAILNAAKELRKQIFEFAASITGEKEDNFEMSDGIIRNVNSTKCFSPEIFKRQVFVDSDTEVKSEPTSSLTLQDLAFYAHYLNKQLYAAGSIGNINSPPWHCSFADVTVDTETGEVTVNKMVGVHDVGRVINLEIVEGQIQGGALQGVGQALGEELTYNKNGQPYVTDIHQYMQPTILDAPPNKALVEEEDDPRGPFGAKGLGETPLVCPAAAITNAVYNALGVSSDHTQVQLPLKPERVLALIQNKT